MNLVWLFFVSFYLLAGGFEMPDSCDPAQYYDPALLSCQFCPTNSSMVKSLDGFSCTCDEHSIPSEPGVCKPCRVTEVVSSDGTACVNRKCQNVSGRMVCRKCPGDYITVTQNFDGSPMKEMQCIKCARGFKPQGNRCVRCDSCLCSKTQVVVRGTCIPKVYVNGRPTYTEKVLHPLELLDVVKHEYLCTKNDLRMCRTLANECTKNFYTSDLGGPCRLWLQPKLAPKGLPLLLVNDTVPGEMNLPRKKGKITLAVVVFTTNGGIIFKETDRQQESCWLPLTVKIGVDITFDCNLNLTKLSLSELNETLSPYVLDGGDYKPLPVSLVKPSGYSVKGSNFPVPRVKAEQWLYFLHAVYTNMESTLICWLHPRRTAVFSNLTRVRLQRDSHANGSLRLQIAMEAQHAAAADQESVTITLKVEHVMPSAGIRRGLEVCGGGLGLVLGLYALVQWRGALRRGGSIYSLGPLLAGAAADTLYFASLLTTVHSLAAEAGTLGMTLPLSRTEEKLIRDFLLSAVSFKILKLAWINWKQCTCDIFFISWSNYNPPVVKDISTENESWPAVTLAREWSQMQTLRRACPAFTIAGTLMFLHLLAPWQFNHPKSQAYNWAVASISWWSSYSLVLVTSWLVDRFLSSPATRLPRVCTAVGRSLVVFQEELYAHYVHGRNDDFQEVKSMAGPLASCRVACVPKLRAVCRQLSTPAPGAMAETESRQMLLSKFLAAFFERALEGLNWVASERTLLERALDVELTSREAGGTSALLYDDDHTPSCFTVTWWGEEWNLSTFDAMVFSCVFIVSGDARVASLVTVSIWQVMKLSRDWLGNRNQVLKTGVRVQF